MAEHHFKYMERPFTPAALGRFVISLMPRSLATDGAKLVSELQQDGTIEDIVVVIERCCELVKLHQNPANKGAILASATQDKETLRTEAICAAIRAGLNAKQVMAFVNAQTNGGSKNKGGKDKGKDKGGNTKGTSRLPDGQRCSKGTCNFNHDITNPGGPCYRDPRYMDGYPDKVAANAPQVARIEKDREINAKRLGIQYKPMPAKPLLYCQPCPPAEAECEEICELDYYGNIFDNSKLMLCAVSDSAMHDCSSFVDAPPEGDGRQPMTDVSYDDDFVPDSPPSLTTSSISPKPCAMDESTQCDIVIKEYLSIRAHTNKTVLG